MTELPEHAQRNRAAWDEWAVGYEEAGQRNWGSDDPSWGIFGVPESQLRMLPEDASGLDAIELGCGTGYVSAWLARRGANVTAIDNSEKQLATARASRRSTGSTSRCSTATPRRSRGRTRASTSRSPSTAPASGATRTNGSPRPRASCARAGAWSFS